MHRYNEEAAKVARMVANGTIPHPHPNHNNFNQGSGFLPSQERDEDFRQAVAYATSVPPSFQNGPLYAASPDLQTSSQHPPSLLPGGNISPAPVTVDEEEVQHLFTLTTANRRRDLQDRYIPIAPAPYARPPPPHPTQPRVQHHSGSIIPGGSLNRLPNQAIDTALTEHQRRLTQGCESCKESKRRCDYMFPCGACIFQSKSCLYR